MYWTIQITTDIGYYRNPEIRLFHILTSKEDRGPWVPIMTGDQYICYFSIWKKCRFIFLWKFSKMAETELQTLLLSGIMLWKKGLKFSFSHFTKFPQEYESTFLP